MSTLLVIVNSTSDRDQVADWARKVPDGTRVQFKAPRRTLPQNAKLWSALSDIVRQKKTINGQHFTTDQWKIIFLQALGREQELLPTLGGEGMFATGYSSSELSVQEMSDLIELIMAWGAENDVVWSDPAIESYERMRTR